MFKGRGSRGWLVVALLLLSILAGRLPLSRAAPGGVWSSPTAEPVVAIEPPEQVVDLGATFTVTVYVVDAQDLGAYQFDMNWDPTLFYVHDVVNGPFLGSTGRQVPDFPAADIDNDVGTLTFARFSTDAGTPGPTGDGDLAYIIMEAIEVGSSALDLHDVILANVAGDPTTPTVTDGTAEATAGSGPTPTAVATATPTGTPADTATGTPARTATPGATATPTRTPQAGQTQVAASPTVTSGPAEAVTEAPEPTATSAGEVGEGATVTGVPPMASSATPQVTLTPESELAPTGATEKPAAGLAEREQAASGTSPWLIGGAVALAIVGIVAIAVGVSWLKSSK